MKILLNHYSVASVETSVALGFQWNYVYYCRLLFNVLDYISCMKSSSSDAKKEKPKAKKEKKAKKEGRKRLRGTTFWYGTTKPSFLIERIFASGPDFEAKVTDVSNDMELLGKPMKGEGKFSRGNTSTMQIL